VPARAGYTQALTWRSPAIPVAACFAISLLLSSCAANKPAEEDTWIKDKPLLTKSLDEIYKMQAKLGEQVQTLQKNVQDMQTSSAKQEARLAALEASVRHFSKNAPDIKKEIRLQEKASRSLVRKIDRIASVIKKASLSGKKKKAVLAKKQTEPGQNTEDEKNRYTAAYLSFKSGRYDESASALLSIVGDYPKGEYTDQAYYWLGESYKAQNKIDLAIAAYRMVVNKYSSSAKDAAALLRLGRIYRQLHRPKKMREALQLLLKRHPGVPETEEARAILGIRASGRQ